MDIIKTVSYTDLDDAFYSASRLASDDSTSSVSETVAAVLRDVRTDGDAAVRSYAQKFDRINLSSFEIPKNVLHHAEEKLKAQKPELYRALCLSHDLAYAFAVKQKESFTDFEVELASGMFTGQKTIPVERAGIYVPAGRFPLLSSVVMCITPAKAAGASETVLCTPPRANPNGSDEPYADEGIMAAAAICGADRVFACGGAQAIAAMAYGTETIPRADCIVGPGNKFVAEAKRQVFGTCGIDFVAGPTEVLIIADDSAHPEWIAADMLAQAEHDVDAQAILVTPSLRLADAVKLELAKQLETLATAQTARESITKHGYIVITDDLAQAAAIANKKAPEHLELALDNTDARAALVQAVHNYGSLFIGHEAAEVLGDYAAGLNHTLPTAGSARFTGGLSVRHFLKTVTTLRTVDTAAKGYRASLATADELGRTEGLEAHAAAARVRL